MTTVLVPRGGAWGASVAAAVAGEGLVPWVLPLVETLPAPSAELTRALARLREGGYDWLAVTSAAAVPALAEVTVPAATRVAAIGAATRSALEESGTAVALVGEGGAAALLAAWPTGEGAVGAVGAVGTVLVVRSDLARGLLADGLRERGYEVEAVVAYRTAAAPVSTPEEHALRGGKADIVLVTSGSVARRLAQMGLPPGTRLVAMGEQTAADTREAGLHPHAVAQAPTVASLLEATKELA